MKRYIFKIILTATAIFMTHCERYLDINEDPNVLGTTDQPKILLPAPQLTLGNTLMGWDLGFAGGFWVEYWTQSYDFSQFKFLCEFEDTEFSSAYTSFTAGVLNDLKRIRTLSDGDSDNAGYAYISEALAIFTWQTLTDLWGDLPYFESLQGDTQVTAPKFDSGETIYRDLEKRIDALLTTDVSALTAIDDKYDFIYAGDLVAWERFAKSLKLKLMMRQSETSGYSNDAALAFVQANDFMEQSAKISGTIWEDSKEGKRHPMREFEAGSASYLSQNVIASKTFIDYLDQNEDPRIKTLFTQPKLGYEGAFFGDYESQRDSDQDNILDKDEVYSKVIFAPNTDLIIMSDWEVNFFIAEVYTRANDLANAKLYYDRAVTASLKQHGIDATEIITTGYAQWTDGTMEENLKQIAMQKWVADANYQHTEAFLERNRTKYPALNPIDIKANREAAFEAFPVGDLTNSVVGKRKTNGRMPSTPIYPLSILNRNINAPDQKADLLQKVWWDKKLGN